MKTTKIYDTYARDIDITFILEDTFEDGECISTEVKGFYYGGPSKNGTAMYYNKIKAEFTMGRNK